MSPVRRVRRVIRKIDPWTVLKVTLVLNAIAALAFVLGSVVFWSVFVNAGIPDKIAEFAEKLTLSFEADGPTYFRVVLLLSIIWTVGTTGALTVGALLYNLISDVVGGIEVVVLEETLVVPAQAVQQQAPAAGTRKVRKALWKRPQRPAAATPAQEPAPAPAPAERPALQPVPPPAARPAAVGEPTAETPAPEPKPPVPAAPAAAGPPLAAPAPEPTAAPPKADANGEVRDGVDEPVSAREASR